MKKTHLKNILLTTIVSSVVVVALSIGYYFVFALPKIQRDKLILEKEKLNLQIDEKSEAQTTKERYDICSKEAKEEAVNLLKDKLELMVKLNETGSYLYKQSKIAYDQGLYLKDDYDNYYKNCLNRYGLEIPNKPR